MKIKQCFLVICVLFFEPLILMTLINISQRRDMYFLFVLQESEKEMKLFIKKNQEEIFLQAQLNMKTS